MLIGMRNQARADKNFALSDQIRDQLIAIGIQLRTVKRELLSPSKSKLNLKHRC
jgi:cysteinyl-tRNA synthetase